MTMSVVITTSAHYPVVITTSVVMTASAHHPLPASHDPMNPVPTMGGNITSGEPVMSGGAFNQVGGWVGGWVNGWVGATTLSLAGG